MSGYIGAQNPFTDQERVAIRSYCGYPAYAYFGWVFEADYSTLEERMSNMSDDEISRIRTNYLQVLPGLETAINNASTTLNVAVAAAFTRNPNEMAERNDQFNRLRRRLCSEFGVSPGEGLGRKGMVTRV